MLKIIQWGTGTAGRLTAQAVHESPDFELVGCYVHTDAKNGRDVGDICGIGPIGVTATTDKEAIFAMPADCVLYMTMEEFTADRAIDDICRLLASGKNVIATAATILYHPAAIGQDAVDRLEAACREGGTSYLGSGIEPGWASVVLPMLLSSVSKRIDTLHIREVVSYRDYDTTASMIDMMGFGQAPKPMPPTPVPMEHVGAYGSLLLFLAKAFDFTIDEVIVELDDVAADKDYDIAVGRIAAGTVAAKHYAFTLVVDGKQKVRLEHFTRAAGPGPMGWPQGDGLFVTTTGEPSLDLSVKLALHGTKPTDDGSLMAAMYVVHSIRYVCDAAPGIRSVLDLPMIVGANLL